MSEMTPALVEALRKKSGNFSAWVPRPPTGTVELRGSCPRCSGAVSCVFVYDSGESPENYCSYSTHVCTDPTCDYCEDGAARESVAHVFCPELTCSFCGRGPS